jgi:hypothetical protein
VADWWGGASGGSVVSSYWDTTTSQRNESYGGNEIGVDTPTLKKALPHGFSSPPWSISPTASYPILTASNVYVPATKSVKYSFAARPSTGLPSIFDSTLSLFDLGNSVNSGHGLYTSFPLGQLQKFNYHIYNVYAATDACVGASFAMIARLIGAKHPEFLVGTYPDPYPDGSSDK